MVQPVSRCGVVEAGPERGRHDVDGAERHRQSFAEADFACGRGAQGASVARAVDDGRKKPVQPVEAQDAEKGRLVGPGAEIAEGMYAFGGVGGAHAGELEEQPVLEVERGRGTLGNLRPVVDQPPKLRPHLTGRETRAGAFEMAPSRGIGAQRFRDAGRSGIEPDQRRTGRFALGIDEPRPVALCGHRDGGRPRRKVRHHAGEAPEGRGRIGPGGGHVLLGPDLIDHPIAVRARESTDLLALRREGDRLDHRCAGIDADQKVAGHQPSVPRGRAAKRQRTSGRPARMAGASCCCPARLILARRRPGDQAGHPRSSRR